MPTLYYVPMVHTPQELGSLKDAILIARTKLCGEKATSKFLQEVEDYWQEVARRIQHIGLYRPKIASRLHIFVDGLPNTEEALVKKIVEELITQKIPVYLIIEKLRENGATICGTEDLKLLLREHRYWTEISQGKTHDQTTAQELLRGRDQAIAQHINAVVPDEESGLLFIGRAHNVISKLNKLSKRFTIVYL